MRVDPSDPRTVRVRLEGGHVTVTRGAEYRRVWRDVIAIQLDEKGGRKVLAVGDGRDELAKGASAEELRALEETRFRSALSPDDFDPEVALAFLKYVVRTAHRELPTWRSIRKPPFEVELPGYEAITDRLQLAFEDDLRGWGSPTILNGRPARPLSRTLDRTSSAVLGLVGAGLVVLLPDGDAGTRAVTLVSAAAIALVWSAVESRWRARLLAGAGAPAVRRRDR